MKCRLIILVFLFIIDFLKAELFEPGSAGNIINLSIVNNSNYFKLNELTMAQNVSTSEWIKIIDYATQIGTIEPNSSRTIPILFNLDYDTRGDEKGVISFVLTASSGDTYTVEIEIETTIIFSDIFLENDLEIIQVSSDPVMYWSKPINWSIQGDYWYWLPYKAPGNVYCANIFGYIPESLYQLSESLSMWTRPYANMESLAYSELILNDYISVDSKYDYNVELSVWIELPKSLDQYIDLNAKHSVYIDKGNGWQIAIEPSIEYHEQYSPKPGDSDYLTWLNDAPGTYVEYRQNLGKASNIGIKLAMDPYNNTNNYSYAFYDNISLYYTKDSNLGQAPTNLTVTVDGTSAELSWGTPVKDKSNSPLYYRLYKNGNVIADNLFTLSYIDNNNKYGEIVEYAISAVYDGLLMPSSIFDCWAKVKTADLNPPAPSNLQLVSSGVGNCDINLTWSSVAAIVLDEYKLTNYNIYKNKMKIATLPSDITYYNDLLVSEGTHEYYVTCVYDYRHESSNSELLNYDITINEILPDQFYDFENSGQFPLNWACSIPTLLNNPKWQIQSYNGNYFTQINAIYNSFLIPPDMSIVSIKNANDYSKLRSPKFNFADYTDVKLSFDYKTSTILENSNNNSKSYLIVKYFDQLTDIVDTLQIITLPNVAWKNIEIPVSNDLNSSQSFFIFELKQDMIEPLNPTYIFNYSFSIDNVSVTGIYLPSPSELKVLVGSGSEYNNVTLNWTGSDTDEKISYNVYRDNVFIGTTKKTTYTDCFLEAGEYTYKTFYQNYIAESVPTNFATAAIESIEFLPYEESFENAGAIPIEWSQFVPAVEYPYWEFVIQSFEGISGSLPGEYYAYLRGDPLSRILSTVGHAATVLKTKMLNLSAYDNVYISYDFITQSTNDGRLSSLKTYVVDDRTVSNGSFLISENTGDYSEWQGVGYIPIPKQGLTDSCHIEFHGTTYNDKKGNTDIASVFLDYILITGEMANPPDNIKIVNNQGFVTLSWDPVPGARSYHIYRSEYSDKNFTEIAEVTPSSYTDIIKSPSSSSNPHTGTISVAPAVDNFRKPYYYKVATETLPSVKSTKDK